MNLRLVTPVFGCLAYQPLVHAATETAAVSSTGSIFKMVLGLIVVLAVIALISWVVKRMIPGVTSQQSILRVVGGASVGSRERIVVLEIADRWIVVGVAPGQVNALANLEAISGSGAEDDIVKTVSGINQTTGTSAIHPMVKPLVKPFAEWLRRSTQKVNDKLAKSKDADNKR